MTLHTLSTRAARTFLAELRVEIAQHPAVNHLFLNRLATSPFSQQDYRVFAENHYPLVCVFTHYLEQLLIRAPDSDAKLWIARVLVDEYGEGSDGDDHAELYGRFLTAAGGDPVAIRAQRLPPPAHGFIAAHRELVRTRPFLEGLGAVGPGHEWAIPAMFDAVIPGLRRAGFDEEVIHYFVLHTAQDEDHGAWLEEALVSLAGTDDQRRQIRRGALASLAARGRFWAGVQSEVVRWRQPRSARQDGVRARSVAREVLATAWDGTAWARRAHRARRALRDRGRPTLAALLARTREVAP